MNYIDFAQCSRIANKIWRGRFPRTGQTKWADSTEMGIDFINDHCAVNGEYRQVTETLEMKLIPSDFNIGRFVVRRVQKQGA